MLSAGTVVDRYEVLGLLGQGNMAQVYAVRHRVLGSEHVLKVLKRSSVAGRARLVREGQVQARLKHPNVVEVTDVVEVGPALALVMERVHGPSLDRVLATERMSRELIEAVVPGICAGLAAAHAFGVVHRDLKPANVLLQLRGDVVVPKVADFGLVKRDEPDGSGLLTASGAMMGTPVYMAPEQIRGTRDVDARADVWALGALLYELATGRRAFRGLTMFAILEAVAAGRFVPPEEVDPTLPPRWCEAIGACLQPLATRAKSVEAVYSTWTGGASLSGSPTPAAWPDAALERIRALGSSLAPVPERIGWDDPREDPDTWVDAMPRTPPAAVAKHNLPRERDVFVGRASDLDTLGRRLDEGARLVTVLGFGGTGKTRLVTRFGWARLHASPGGVRFCDLSDARDAMGIASAVARALEVPLGDGEPVAQLGRAIAGLGPCLVVLDNFEQVTAHAAETVGHWLDRAPEAQFVVTSREVLGLPGENALSLAPLPRDEAVALFIARAEAAKVDFRLSDSERADVEALVGLLDGLPLAIELAVARVRVMPPSALLERMSDRFRLLASAGGRRDRHASLRGALDWSWELLTPDEQTALAQVSVFEGGFTLEAAEGILRLDALWPMDAVQALVDKSLVRPVSDDRFDLLVSVQAYAAEQLDASGQRAAVEARHADWFAQFGEHDAIDALGVHGGVGRLAALTREVDNLLAACRRCVARGAVDPAVALLRAAWEVLQMTGPSSVALDLAERVHAIAREPGRSSRVAAYLLGRCLDLVGRTGEALEILDAALRARAGGPGRSAHDRRLEGDVQCQLGQVYLNARRLDDAKVAFEAALEAAREDLPGSGRDLQLEGLALRKLGSLFRQQGRVEQSESCYDESLAVVRAVGHRRLEGLGLGQLGILHMERGRLDEARACLDAALAVHREVGDRRMESQVLGHLGVLHVEQGRADEGRDHLEAALAIQRRVGGRNAQGILLGNLGALHLDQGRLDDARACLDGALALDREVGDRRAEGLVLGNLGSLYRRQGRMEEARVHFEAALAAARETGQRRIEGAWHHHLAGLLLAEGQRAAAREHLGDGDRLLRAVDDRLELAKLLCVRARVESAEGRADAARDALSEAELLAATFAASPDGELGRLLVEARREVGAPSLRG